MIERHHLARSERTLAAFVTCIATASVGLTCPTRLWAAASLHGPTGDVWSGSALHAWSTEASDRMKRAANLNGLTMDNRRGGLAIEMPCPMTTSAKGIAVLIRACSTQAAGWDARNGKRRVAAPNLCHSQRLWAAAIADNSMVFCRSAASRAIDSFGIRPPLPPAAERCTFTAVVSTM